MLTQRGFEMNPEKCAVIINMRSPTSVKEVQQLTGRMASVSRFIPKAGEKSYPYFQCLRGNSYFTWTEECEKALQMLKETMTTPLILIKPKAGLPVFLYLCVAERTISTKNNARGGEGAYL